MIRVVNVLRRSFTTGRVMDETTLWTTRAGSDGDVHKSIGMLVEGDIVFVIESDDVGESFVISKLGIGWVSTDRLDELK